MPRETKHWSTALEVLDACAVGVTWARAQPSFAAAWEHCERADWMLWLLGRAQAQADPRQLVLVACECARAVLHLVPPGEDRPRLAIEAAEAWAANPRAENVAASAAASAANAAGWAAMSVAASAAAWDTVSAAALKGYCEIVRRYFPAPPELEASHATRK